MIVDDLVSGMSSPQEAEEFAFRLLASLPRSRLATIQRRIAPLLQFDVVGSLPAEVSLQIFSYLPFQSLLTSALVCRRWQTLADDQSLWKTLCQARGWKWRMASRTPSADNARPLDWDHSDDEGMGDSDEDDDDSQSLENTRLQLELTYVHNEQDSGFASTSMLVPASQNFRDTLPPPLTSSKRRIATRWARHSAPSVLESEATFRKPDYKLLHQTHIKLRNRFLSSPPQLSVLQKRGSPVDGHNTTIYCLQLYTYPETGKQVLFTGSRDKTIREWNLDTNMVERVITGVHSSSVLSLCAHGGYIASASSDRRVAVWQLESSKLVKILLDHEESVLCVRFDDQRLVSCSKDRTVRVYSFPDLEFQYVLHAHRAAVNAVSISKSFIVSASGDRSIKLWEATTGKLLRTFDNHHSRGIASIDFCLPFVLSGSSDKHLRLFDMTTLQGWSTSPEYDDATSPTNSVLPFPPTDSDIDQPQFVCQSCGSHSVEPVDPPRNFQNRGGLRRVHGDLVRSVALGDDFVLSGSYDRTIKVWDRKTGVLITDLSGGHSGRIFCVGFDSKKIVSCGEDQKICIWDFSYGIDTSFVDWS